jgi:hypothetical protein
MPIALSTTKKSAASLNSTQGSKDQTMVTSSRPAAPNESSRLNETLQDAL